MAPEILATIRQLPFEELRTLHHTIETLLAERRAEVLHELRERAASLGFTADDLVAQKRGRSFVKFKDAEGNAWSGKGKRPRWLQAKLDAGHDLSEFTVE